MSDQPESGDSEDSEDSEDFKETEETENLEDIDQDGLTYADVGVDIEASEAATASLIAATGDFEGEYAGLVDLGDSYLALATDGVGTKLLVAEAIEDYSTIGIDCLAMNVNDLVAQGVTPVAFVDYLAVEQPDEVVATQIGEGLRRGSEAADVALVGGETAVLPEVIVGIDIAGACAGLAPKDAVFDGVARPGDAIVGWPSSGIHSNGLTLARKAATRRHEYSDDFPPDPDRTIADALLEPTRLYTDLLEPLQSVETHGCAHVTGGGLTNLFRLGDHRYVISDPLAVPPVFEFIREEGEVEAEEMYRTFNMGIGFVACLPEDEAVRLAEVTTDGRVIGHVEAGERAVTIRDLVIS